VLVLWKGNVLQCTRKLNPRVNTVDKCHGVCRPVGRRGRGGRSRKVQARVTAAEKKSRKVVVVVVKRAPDTTSDVVTAAVNDTYLKFA
jgi:hypothetical protein